jgi:hypothetical protein
MKERWGPSGRLLELVQDTAQLSLRLGNIVTGREQMAGVEAIPGAGMQSFRHRVENRGDFGGGASQCRTRTRGVLHQQPGLATDRIEGFRHGLSHALGGRVSVAGERRPRMKAYPRHSQRG